MAAPKIVKYDPIKRGDTETFGFEFEAPTDDYDWSGTTLDAAMTNVSAPSDNSGAAALRLNQTLTIDATTNIASFQFTLTHPESMALIPDSTYHVECQLKQNGTNFVKTPVTGEVKILQDWVVN